MKKTSENNSKKMLKKSAKSDRESPKYKDKEYLKEQIEKKNKSYKQVAEELGASDTTVRMWAGRLNIVKPIEDESYLRGLHQAGMSASEIAEEIDAKNYEVIIKLERMGLR